jgi:hypothetical protein
MDFFQDMKTMMLVFANTILLSMLYQHVECYGQFYGGSMSYVMEKQPDGNQLVTSYCHFILFLLDIKDLTTTILVWKYMVPKPEYVYTVCSYLYFISFKRLI